MKRILLYFFISLLPISSLLAQQYHEEEVAALKEFLMQPSAEAGKKNYEQLGFTSEPDWNDENWVPVVKNITWDNSVPKRITDISWASHRLAGTLNLTVCSQLRVLRCYTNQLTEINVAGLSALQTLDCCSNQFTSIDLSGLTSLSFLCCYNNQLTSLDVSDSPNLYHLNCSQNQLPLSQLPSTSSKLTSYTYAPQRSVDGGETYTGKVDLSSQLRNDKTKFRWYLKDDQSTELTDIIQENEDGTFTIPPHYIGMDLICKMTNEDFPAFERSPLTYTITYKGVEYTIDCQSIVYETELRVGEKSKATDIIKLNIETLPSYIGAPYVIETDVVNGIQFAASGTITNETQEILLTADGGIPRDAGMYTYTIRIANVTQGSYCTVDIPVYKSIVVDGMTIKNKVYDGTADASIDNTGVLNGVISGDEVLLNIENALTKFTSVDAGNDIPVTISGLSLSGTDAGKYILEQPTYLKANITKAPQIINFPEFTKKRVGEEPFNANVTIDTDLPLTYTSSNPNIAKIVSDGTITINKSGTVTITASQSGNNNYLSAVASRELNIVSDDATLHKVRINGQRVTVSDNMYYDLGCGDETEFIIVLDTEDNATVDVGKTINLTIDKPMLKVVEIVVTSHSGEYTKKYTITIEKRFKFEDIVVTRWNNTMTIINNPANNGGYKFRTFKWFKNGAEFAIGQSYSAGSQGERLSATDRYYVEVTDDEFEGTLRSCEGYPNLKTDVVKVYPNPATKGETVWVEADVDEALLEGAYIDIYSVTGIKIAQVKMQGRQTSVPLDKATSGMYIFKLRGKDGFTTDLKVIVK